MTLDTPSAWLALTTYCDREARVSAAVERLVADALRFPYQWALDWTRLCAKQDGARLAMVTNEERRAYWSEHAEAWGRVAERVEATGAFEWGRLAARRHHRLSLAAPADRTGEDAEGWAHMGKCIKQAMCVSDRQAPMLARAKRWAAERQAQVQGRKPWKGGGHGQGSRVQAAR